MVTDPGALVQTNCIGLCLEIWACNDSEHFTTVLPHSHSREPFNKSPSEIAPKSLPGPWPSPRSERFAYQLLPDYAEAYTRHLWLYLTYIHLEKILFWSIKLGGGGWGWGWIWGSAENPIAPPPARLPKKIIEQFIISVLLNISLTAYVCY